MGLNRGVWVSASTRLVSDVIQKPVCHRCQDSGRSSKVVFFAFLRASGLTFLLILDPLETALKLDAFSR